MQSLGDSDLIPFPFSRAVSAEYTSTTASGYDCRLGDLCDRCQSSARHWRDNDVQLLKVRRDLLRFLLIDSWSWDEKDSRLF